MDFIFRSYSGHSIKAHHITIIFPSDYWWFWFCFSNHFNGTLFAFLQVNSFVWSASKQFAVRWFWGHAVVLTCYLNAWSEIASSLRRKFGRPCCTVHVRNGKRKKDYEWDVAQQLRPWDVNQKNEGYIITVCKPRFFLWWKFVFFFKEDVDWYRFLVANLGPY